MLYFRVAGKPPCGDYQGQNQECAENRGARHDHPVGPEGADLPFSTVSQPQTFAETCRRIRKIFEIQWSRPARRPKTMARFDLRSPARIVRIPIAVFVGIRGAAVEPLRLY